MHGTSIGLEARSTDDLIERLKRGLPPSAFERLREHLDLASDALAHLTGVSTRTLARRKKQDAPLAPDTSERLLRIARLYEIATDVLMGEAEARRWLKAPNTALGGQSPLDYADTEPGAREVEDLLGRLAHGVFV
ncbi:MAG: antitoxin Xre/MbcA/ParS toxin-binding domain-containing protein [Rhodothermales bacterium]